MSNMTEIFYDQYSEHIASLRRVKSPVLHEGQDHVLDAVRLGLDRIVLQIED